MEFSFDKGCFWKWSFLNVTKGGDVQKSNYSKEFFFKVVDTKFVRFLTRPSSMLRYNKNSIY